MKYRMTVPIAAVLAFCVSLISGCSSDTGSSGHGQGPHSMDEKNVAVKAPGAGGKSALVFSGASATAKSGSGFPAHYAAPYVEAWGSPSVLKQAREGAGQKYFTLASVLDSGGCEAKLNGQVDLNDPGWISAINATRAAGGDVMASFGGARGKELAVSCKSVDALKTQYKTVVDTLSLSRIDLDIETKQLDDEAANDRRNKALAQLQREYKKTGGTLDVDYTLPVGPKGLRSASLALLENAKSNGVDVNLVNIMTMDYGSKVDDMGGAAISAAKSLHDQLHDIWPAKTDSQLWAMEGNTPKIGVNDTRSGVFSVTDAKKLVEFARSKGIQQLAFWSLTRDQMCGQGRNDDSENCSGTTQRDWDFSRLMKKIGDSKAPVPSKVPVTPKPEYPTPPKNSSPKSTPAAPATHHPSIPPKSTSPFRITGQVLCASGRPVVGVWVQAAHAADSRFAAWRGIGDGASADWWTELPRNEKYSLHVGCGGTPDRWGSENKTGTVSGGHNSFNCDDVAGDANYGKCARR